MLNVLVNIPSSTDIISAIADVSNPWYNTLVPFAYFAIGIIGALIVVAWLINFFSNKISNFHFNFGKENDKLSPFQSQSEQMLEFAKKRQKISQDLDNAYVDYLKSKGQY